MSSGRMVPRVGFELTTYRLRSGCSTAELSGPRRSARDNRSPGPLLARNPFAAKPIRGVNRYSTTWPQVGGWGERAIAVIAAISTERAVSDNPTDALRDTTEIEMLEAKERWNEYRLADGTTLRLKPVIIAVFRADGQFTPDGEPV